MALGANRGSVVWLVMREVLVLSVIGVAIGRAGAYAATRLVQKELFGILPTDALTMVLSAVGIATVAIVSGYLPARRATAIDPMLRAPLGVARNLTVRPQLLIERTLITVGRRLIAQRKQSRPRESKDCDGGSPA